MARGAGGAGPAVSVRITITLLDDQLDAHQPVALEVNEWIENVEDVLSLHLDGALLEWQLSGQLKLGSIVRLARPPAPLRPDSS